MDDDERMDEAEDSREPQLPLSEDERRVLELYDKLQQLQLEIAILNAQKSHQSASNDDSPEALAEAQDALLHSRSRYRLRNDAVELVMMANPVLKAVHGGTNASPIERDLLPYITKRDDASVSVAQSAARTQNVRTALNDVQAETMRVCRRNVNLTNKLFSLAGQLKERRAVDWDGGAEALRVRGERRKWRVVKGAASGIVAGSGVDWAADETLRDMVLDPEDDE